MDKDKVYVGYWNEVRKGNVNALFELHEALFYDLRNFGLRYTADIQTSRDAINEAFMEIWDKRNELPEVHNVKSYLLTYLKRKILRNQYYDDLRLQSIESQPEEIQFSYEEIVINAEIDADRKMMVEKAFSKLTSSQSELIRLKFFDEYSYEEIAKIKSISVKTAYNTIYNALTILRTEIKASLKKS